MSGSDVLAYGAARLGVGLASGRRKRLFLLVLHPAIAYKNAQSLNSLHQDMANFLVFDLGFWSSRSPAGPACPVLTHRV